MPSPIVVYHRSPPKRRPARSTDHDVRADHGVRTDDRTWPMLAPGWTMRRRIDLRLSHGPPARGPPRPPLAIDLRRRLGTHDRPRRRSSDTSRRRRSPGTTCLRNLALSTPRSVTRDAPAEQRRDLRQRLDHQHARHDRRTREMPLKELLVDGDVLDGDDAAPGLVLEDVINEKRWIPKGETLDNWVMEDKDCYRIVQSSKFKRLQSGHVTVVRSSHASQSKCRRNCNCAGQL